MKGKKIKAKLISSALSCAMVLSMVTPAFADNAPAADPVTMDDVASIQAFTDETMYGTGVVEVKVTYKDGVDISKLTADSFILEDRGSLHPDFGQITIDSVKVEGQEAILTISDATAATEANKMVYTGDNKEGARQRNAFGIYCTGAWYYDENGVIHYGSDDNDAYENNTTKMGYQARETLELKLRHADEEAEAAECLATDKGQYNADGKWLETVDRQIGEGKFQNLYDLKIPSTAAGAEDGTGDDYVQGYYYVPENYNPANGIVFTLQGQGISYWKLADGCDDAGTGFMYDSATASWADNGAIVVNIHDRSTACPGGYTETYDFVIDDANVMKYFLEKYNVTGEIVLQGNSRGTMASDVIIKALAGRPYSPLEQGMGYQGEKPKTLDKSVYDFTIDTFICQNGSFGGTIWEDDDFKAIAETGLRAWIFDGEQDTNNIETYGKYIELMAAEGKSEEWIAENVRLTGLTSNLFYPWGESDHSVTRINGWYFDDAAYYGPDLTIDENGEIVYGTKLNDGDTYVLEGRGAAATNSKAGYEYVVYDELFQEWAVKGDKGMTAVDLSTVEAPTHDYTESNQLPLTGYFKTNLTDAFADREVYYYIPETAIIRPYYHFITVPNDTDVDTFIEESGWKQVADETGECLYIMTPADGKWGDAAEEAEYITAAQKFHGKNGAYFTTFGMFYLEGYGEGAAPLEAWASMNPHLVISQAYVGGASCGEELLETNGNVSYGWNHMTDGDIRGTRVDANGNQKILNQIVPRLADIVNSDKTGYEGLLTKADMPVPTWLINSEEDDLGYWQTVNKAGEAVDGEFGEINAECVVYPQAGDTWATEYSGQISKVTSVTTEADTESYEFTRALRDEVTDYTRYDNSICYGNGLTYRMDITPIQVERYSSETKEATGTSQAILKNGDVVEGEVTIKALTMPDGYIADMLMYVPETCGDKDIPVVVVWHGGSQTGHLFMEASAWWQVAAQEGVAIVLPTRTNHNQRTSADYDLPIFDEVVKELEADGRFDMGRIYSTGQSMGGVASVSLAEFRTNDLAASVATNAGKTEAFSGGDPIPTGYVTGEGNYANRGIPGYMADTNYEEDETDLIVRSTEAAAAGADIYWDAVYDAEGNVQEFAKWVGYFTDANKVDNSNLSPYIEYTGGNALNQGVDNLKGTLADWNTNNARYRTWKWYNEDEIPVMMYMMTLYEAHNNIMGQAEKVWDFMEHYRVDENADGTVTRSYSASAFEADDTQTIVYGKKPVVEQSEQVVTTKTASKVMVPYSKNASFNLKAKTTGDGELTYKSGNTKVATVNSKGKVTIVGTGKTVITVTAAETESCKAASKKITLYVVPKKAEIAKVKAGKKSLSVSIKADKMATGYVIQYSTSKNFKKSTSVVVGKAGATKATIKGLVSGKKYYVRVCGYKTISGNKYCGSYGKAVSCKVK